MKDKYDKMTSIELRALLKEHKLGPSGRWRADCTVDAAKIVLREHDESRGDRKGDNQVAHDNDLADSLAKVEVVIFRDETEHGDHPLSLGSEAITHALYDQFGIGVLPRCIDSNDVPINSWGKKKIAISLATRRVYLTVNIKRLSERPDLPPLPPKEKPAENGNPVEGAMKVLLEAANRPSVSEARVLEIVRDNAIEDGTIREWVRKYTTAPTILVKRDALPEIEISRQHYKFPLLLACAEAPTPVNVMLVGPAGSGKTTVAGAVAKVTAREFEPYSFGPMSSKSDIVGMRDAQGVYHESAMVRMVRSGGVYLADEMDAANAGVLTQANMVLSNPHLSTPDGLVEKHDRFWYIGGCNTYGVGANRQYVGRNQLDAATLDRFAVIDFPVDEGLEAHACGLSRTSPQFKLDKGGIPTTDEWLEHVQRVRHVIEKQEVRHIVSPRASILGVNLIASQVGKSHLEDMLIWKGMDTATRKKIEGAL
jgi:ribosomal protein L9